MKPQKEIKNKKKCGGQLCEEVSGDFTVCVV